MKKRPIRKKRRDRQPASNKICKGDQVIAKSGVNRNRIGTVLSVVGTKVVVQGLNVRKKGVKASQTSPQGGFVEREMPIHVSNLRLCVNGKPVKLKTRVLEGGGKELYYMDGEQAVTYRELKK
jgi:large subunit ribosomal protein L24